MGKIASTSGRARLARSSPDPSFVRHITPASPSLSCNGFLFCFQQQRDQSAEDALIPILVQHLLFFSALREIVWAIRRNFASGQ